MSDLTQQFVVTVTGGAGTQHTTVPFDGDLVQVTARLDAAGSTASTVDVQVNGTTVFGATPGAVASGDAGASITSSKLQIAGDSASVTGTAKAKSAVHSGMANEITNNVTSGIDFWWPVAPADAVLKACSAGDDIKVVTTAGTGATDVAVSLVFAKK